MKRQQAGTLIRTKLRPPFTRLELVPRPRLQAQIAEGLRRPLTLITAPAGFGKTTLVASCIDICHMPVAWFSLDDEDNQGQRFLRYLVAAVEGLGSGVGQEAAELLAAAREARVQTILTSLVNDLATASTEMALVLDDYQVIHTPAVHAQVTFLLDHCPTNFHLVITTRSDPQLSLTRLRARGQMVELRAADLRFTRHEAAQFLNDVMGLGLDAGSIGVLEERTEGWIAGLQMAALSMRDRQDVPGFLAGFSGTNRYVLDYLLDEVLISQPAEIQRFLLYTSILERLNAPLCAALLSGQEIRATAPLDSSIPDDSIPDSPQPDRPAPNSQSTLEYLERANLFLVPLDDERLWYRYHHLFADLLRAQLRRSLGARAVAELHVRAAEWHEQNGSILEAIHHASAAAEDERVERLIEHSYMEIVSRGEQSLMRFWAGKLSKDLVYRRPWLCIYEAHSHAWFGELDEADLLLEKAKEHFQLAPSTPDARSMRAHHAYVKSRVMAMRGDHQRAIDICLAACDMVPSDNLSLQFNTRVTLGYEYFLIGDYAHASPILSDAIRSGIEAGALIYTVAASCMMARLFANQGRLHESYDTYEMAAQLIAGAAEEHRDATALVKAGMAGVLCEWNDLDAALAQAEQGLTLMRFWGKADDYILVYVTLARIHLAQGRVSDARKDIEDAIQIMRTSGTFVEARQALETAQVRLWLAEGDLQAAGHWAASREQRSGSDDRFRFENELAHITRARVSLAQKKPADAVDLLWHLDAAARQAGRLGRLVEIRVVQALAMQATGDSEHALLALSECLSVSEPEGYARIYLDEGEPMRALLAQWLARAGAGTTRDYAIRLLSHFDPEPVVAPQHTSPGDGMIEPLSQRELEVLYLIALGKTNQEIAHQLIVAVGTVKAHTSSIYRKLDVANRTEAAARARQLGVLPPL